MKTIYKLLAVIIGLPAILLLFANSNGSPGGYTGSAGDGNQTCTSCHGGSATNQSGWISSNIPASGYTPGQTYQISLTAVHSGAPRFGFELTSENSNAQKVGTFVITEPSRTRLVNQNRSVTHTFAGTSASGGTTTWTVNWTAPLTNIGQVRFFAAVNAANGNGGTSGDVIYRTTLFVDPAAPAALLSVNPSQANQGSNPDLTITGQNTNWAGTSPTVRLRKSGTTNQFIDAGSVNVNSNTQLLAAFQIDPQATPGLWDVLVNDLVLASSFTIIELIPSLVGIVPNFGARGQTISTTITGVNTFWQTATPSVSLTFSGSLPTMIEASSVTATSNTSLQASFTIPQEAALGFYDLNVGAFLTLNNAFTVTTIDNVAENNNNMLKLYPNPAKDIVQFEGIDATYVRIFDFSGRVLLERNVTNTQKQLDIQELRSGVYIVELSNQLQRFTQRLIVR